MKQAQIKKTTKRSSPADTDRRTPSGKVLPY